MIDFYFYFSLCNIKIVDATIEPLVAWLRLSFNDSSISGMVLQYKGVDGLWKCLLNRKIFKYILIIIRNN